MKPVTMQILDELTGAPGAHVVRRDGQFDVDEQQARELLGWMRLEDPRRYVLELVHVASLLGTSFVTMHIDTTLMSVSFNGECFSADELDDLYSAAFRERRTARDEALRYLALALGAAQALHPSHVEIEARSREHAHRLRIRHDGPDTLESREHDSVEGMRVQVRQRPQLRHAKVFWDRVRDRQVEVELLRERCRFAQFPVMVNQERVSHGLHLVRDCDVEVAWRDARSSGVLGVSFVDRDSQIIWVHHGVVVRIQRLRHDGFCVDAVLEVPGLQLDLARGDVVEDQAWHHAKHHTLDDQMHRALRRALEPLIVHDRLDVGTHHLKEMSKSHAWLARVDGLLLRRIVCDVCVGAGQWCHSGKIIPAHTRALLEVFEAARLWPAASSVQEDKPWVRSLVSMHDFGVGLGRSGTLYVSRERILVRYFSDGRHVLWVREYDQERPAQVLLDYLGVKCVDVTEKMRHAHTRMLNISAWQERLPWPALNPKRHLVMMCKLLKNGSVELGLSVGGRAHAECLMAPDKKLMRVAQLDGVAPVQATLVWRGALTPTDLHDDVARDEAMWRFALGSIEMWPTMVARWCEALEEPVSTGTRRALLDVLVQWSEGGEGEAMLGALGMWTRTSAARYQVWRKPYTRGLFGISEYRDRTRRTDSELVRLRDRLGRLGELMLCELVSGELVSVGEMLESALELGKLAVVSLEGLDVSRRHWRHADVKRPVVVLDERTGRLVRALCGPDRVLVFDGELARRAGEQRFLSMRKEKPVLGRNVATLVAITGQGCHGEVGLFEGHIEVPGRCEVRVLYLGRRVAELMLTVPCGRLLAVVDAEFLQPRADWRGVVEDEHYAQMMAQVHAGVREVYHEHVAAMMALHGTVDASGPWFCLMCRLAGMGGRGQLGERLARMVVAQPVWRVASGERMPLAALRGRLSARADLVYATPGMIARVSERVWDAVDRCDVVMVPDRVDQMDTWLIECIEGHHRVMSVEELVQDGDRLERARARFMSRSPRPVELEGEDYLHALRFAGPGRHGKIGLRLDEAPLLCRGEVDVMWMNESRRVMSRKTRTTLGCFDAVWEDEALIDWAQSDEVRREVVHRGEQALVARSHEVWEAYVARICESSAQMSAAARHMVMMYIWQCRERGEEAQVTAWLEQLPVFEDGVMRRWSVAQLRERTHVVCVLVGEQGGAAGIVVRDEAQRRALKGAIFPTEVVYVAQDEHENLPLQGAARVEVARMQVNDLESLADQIAHTIERVCGEAMYLRDPEQTRSVAIVEMESGGASAWVRADGVWLARQSEVVEAWLRFPGVVELGALVSAAYSAMNLYEEVVSDRHEEEFLSRLAAWSMTQMSEPDSKSA